MDKQEKNDGHGHYSDFIAVEKYRNEIIPEITPEGAYGSPIEPPLGKSTPWEDGQQAISGYAYEYKNLHQNLERKDPGAHFTHDDKRMDRGEPF
ncbi:hypothetical protein QA612_15725 [Evansella sp. AB-P1]|uniref:hypothetical protein n=1 Tax=Evansella sp. AB-P1 TaxID=3037653 RepID=UPI00241FAF1B|nr:hypothetical protein [Evansella sp. AB-P1]MDG5788905.1 hypothetical protein [Evansella sp. AB-P1]